MRWIERGSTPQAIPEGPSEPQTKGWSASRIVRQNVDKIAVHGMNPSVCAVIDTGDIGDRRCIPRTAVGRSFHGTLSDPSTIVPEEPARNQEEAVPGRWLAVAGSGNRPMSARRTADGKIGCTGTDSLSTNVHTAGPIGARNDLRRTISKTFSCCWCRRKREMREPL